MTLSPDETTRLRRFQERVQELKDRKFCESGKVTLRQELNFDVPNQKGEAVFSGFDDDAFRAGIQLLRQFTLEQDQVHFLSICKIIRRKCGRQELIDWCNHAKEKWQQKMQSRRPVELKAGDKEFMLRDGLELLFYGSMSHTLKKRADEWDSLSPMLQQAIYFNVQSGMFSLIRCLSIVDSVILHWLDEPSAPVPLLKRDSLVADADVDAEEESNN